LSDADIVTLHAAPPADGSPLIRAAELARMKAQAVLINTARGALIEEAALVDALCTGHLGAAYLDVFKREPYRGRLAELPNVLLTAHAGSYTRETRVEMESEAVRLLLQWFDTNLSAPRLV
jgi:D-3-phosphoglycerate dehydrogenase